MKMMFQLIRRRSAFVAVAAIVVLGFGRASARAAATGVATNAAAAPAAGEQLKVQPPFIAPAIPQSTFAMPKKSEEGRDPFFPKSTYPYDQGSPVTPSKPMPVVADLRLGGISGSPEQPLAIINNVTFGVGDELDVTTKAGRMRIRCLEINKDAGTVMVQLGGERRELRLPR